MGKLFNQIIQSHQLGFEEYEFYIPRTSTLKAVQEGRPLSQREVRDYVNYIINNYYLSMDDSSKLSSFSGEWIKYHADPNLIQRRQQRAYQNLAKDLLNGTKINVLDALWISDNVFIDDLTDERKRIVRKINIGGEMDLLVDTQRKNYMVGELVKELKTRLNKKILSKPVDYNL